MISRTPRPSRSGAPSIKAPLGSAMTWALVAAAFTVGFIVYGWPGLLLALTITVFWMLLQFSRLVRVMRSAASRPVGHVESALMLSTRIGAGLRMVYVVVMTGSLGRRLPHASPGADESWEWSDAGGDALVVDFAGGRSLACSLVRAPEPADGPSAAAATPAPAGSASPRHPGNRIEG